MAITIKNSSIFSRGFFAKHAQKSRSAYGCFVLLPLWLGGQLQPGRPNVITTTRVSPPPGLKYAESTARDVGSAWRIDENTHRMVSYGSKRTGSIWRTPFWPRTGYGWTFDRKHRPSRLALPNGCRAHPPSPSSVTSRAIGAGAGPRRAAWRRWSSCRSLYSAP